MNLASLLDVRANDKILDISCGDGTALSNLRGTMPDAELHGIDVQEDLIQRAQQNYSWGTFVTASAEQLPYDDGRFNALLCSHSLHHYKNPRLVFQEAARVLTQDGILYLVDVMPWLRVQQLLWNWDGCSEPYHFEKYYTLADIKRLGLKSGLRLKRHHVLSLSSGERLAVLANNG